MKKLTAILCLLWAVVWAGASVWATGTANNPNSPYAMTFQGPDPTGNAGYPVSVVNALGTTLDVNVMAGPAMQCVTQCTSPWIVGFGGVGQPVTQSGAWTVGATQGTSPWIVDGSGVIQPVSGTITANQGTSPWVTGFGGIGQPVNCTQTTSPWVVGGTVTANQGTSPWVTGFGGVGQPVTQSGAWTVGATQGTSPWVVSGTVAATQSGAWNVGQSGTWTVNQGTNPWITAGSHSANDASGSDNVGVLPTIAQSGLLVLPNNTRQPLFTDLSGRVKVDGSSVTQPVSGTLGVTQGTTPWIVDGSGVTQPISGNVGQSGAPWSVVGTKTNNNATPGSTNIGSLPSLANAALPSYTEGNQVALSSDLSGRARVTGQQATGAIATADPVVIGGVNGATPLIIRLQMDPTGNTLVQSKVISTAAAPTYSEASVSSLSQNLAGRLRVDASLGTSEGKTKVMQTGTITTTAVTADQVVLTYTVTAGKTLYLEYLTVSADNTTLSATGAIIGEFSLESAAGTKLITDTLQNPTTEDRERFTLTFPEPIPIAASTVIRVVCTPAATTSFKWRANFGGYEK